LVTEKQTLRFLPDGIPADVGFLRLFVSTTYVDMFVLEQQSPFLVAHGGAMKKPPAMDIMGLLGHMRSRWDGQAM
jgi:hypothetical protein